MYALVQAFLVFLMECSSPVRSYKQAILVKETSKLAMYCAWYKVLHWLADKFS